MKNMVNKAFYKVIVIDVGIMESIIIDERHFSTEEEAEGFRKKSEKDNSNICYLIIKVE